MPPLLPTTVTVHAQEGDDSLEDLEVEALCEGGAKTGFGGLEAAMHQVLLLYPLACTIKLYIEV